MYKRSNSARHASIAMLLALWAASFAPGPLRPKSARRVSGNLAGSVQRVRAAEAKRARRKARNLGRCSV